MSTPFPPPPLPDPDDDVDDINGVDVHPAGPRRSYRSLFAQLDRRAWLVIGVLAAAIVVAIVVLVTRGNDGSSRKPIETGRAAEALQRLLDQTSSTKDLASCPFGSVRGYADDIAQQVTMSGPIDDDLQRIVVGTEDSVDEVVCSGRTTDDRVHLVDTVYLYATPVPKDPYADYLKTTRLAGAKAKLDQGTQFGGGTIYPWCITADADVRASCGADWVAGDGRLVLGMQVASSDVNAKHVTAALERELETMAGRLAGPSTTSSTSPSPPPSTSPSTT